MRIGIPALVVGILLLCSCLGTVSESPRPVPEPRPGVEEEAAEPTTPVADPGRVSPPVAEPVRPIEHGSGLMVEPGTLDGGDPDHGQGSGKVFGGQSERCIYRTVVDQKTALAAQLGVVRIDFQFGQIDPVPVNRCGSGRPGTDRPVHSGCE